jgi:hypothetical protein
MLVLTVLYTRLRAAITERVTERLTQHLASWHRKRLQRRCRIDAQRIDYFEVGTRRRY